MTLPIVLAAACSSAEERDEVPSPGGSFTVEEVGRSVEGRPLRAIVFPGAGSPILFLGGIHGSEPASADLVFVLTRHLVVYPEDRAGRPVILLARANPDALQSGRRANAHDVDVNRNFKTANFRPGGSGGAEPLSEPESRAIAAIIERFRPSCIVSVHGPLNCIDPDGGEASRAVAEAMAAAGPLRVRDLQAHPGSLGSYAGLELGLTMITYELDRRSVSPEYAASYLGPHIAPLLVAIRKGGTAP